MGLVSALQNPTRLTQQFPSDSHHQSTQPDDDHSKLPVLIVGAGPVGLVLTILLTKLGVECLIVEKNDEYSRHPQAHFINNRTMEVLRKIEGLVEEIEKLQAPVDLWRKFIYCTSLTGRILGSVDQIQPKDLEKIVSPVFVAHFSHYKLIELLIKQLEKLDFKVYGSKDLDCSEGKHFNGCGILMGHEFVSFKSTDWGISATISFRKEGKSIEKEIKCSMLVGADGAGSTVRKSLGIDLKGERDMLRIVSIHFFSKDLGQYLLKTTPAMLFFILNTQAMGMLVCHDLREGEFVLQIPFFPPQQNVKDFTDEACKKMIKSLAGQDLSDLDVVDIKPWVMNGEVAEKYLSEDNRVVLVGDAAHRFPPAGGFGMNTGIQDAHNLAWKIASVMKEITPWSMLHTYEIERHPIANHNSSLSILNFEAVLEVSSVLGVGLNVAKSVHSFINYRLGSILPHVVQKKIFDGIIKIGFLQLSKYILNDNNPIGSSRLTKVRGIFKDERSLHLLFPVEDLGFRYLKGALVSESGNIVNAPQILSRYRRDYVPCATPGSRLPHMNVRILSKLNEEPILSILDFVSGDKIEFLLIIAPTEESYVIAQSALEVFGEFKVELKVCVIWPATTGTVNTYEYSRSKMALAPWENYVDVVEVKRSESSLSWWCACEMTERGAILVRPDEHIAWRVKSGIVGDPILEMKKVYSAVLGFE